MAAFIKQKSDELKTKVSLSYGQVYFQKLNMPVTRKCLLAYWTAQHLTHRPLFFMLKTFLSLKINFSKRHINFAFIMNSGVKITHNWCLISHCKHNLARWFQLILASFCPVSSQNVVPICRYGWLTCRVFWHMR